MSRNRRLVSQPDPPALESEKEVEEVEEEVVVEEEEEEERKEEEVGEEKKKRKKRDALVAVTPIRSSESGKFTRTVWSEEDEIRILEALVEVREKKGIELKVSDSRDLYDAMKDSLSSDISENCFVDKVKRLRFKFLKMLTKGGFCRDHEKPFYDRAVKVWRDLTAAASGLADLIKFDALTSDSLGGERIRECWRSLDLSIREQFEAGWEKWRGRRRKTGLKLMLKQRQVLLSASNASSPSSASKKSNASKKSKKR